MKLRDENEVGVDFSGDVIREEKTGRTRIRDFIGGFVHLVFTKVGELPGDLKVIKERMGDLGGTNYRLGIKCMKEGKISDALFRFKVVSTFNSKHTKARYFQAQCYYYLRKKKKAVAAVQKVLAIEPDYVEALHLLRKLENIEAVDSVPMETVREKYDFIADQYEERFVDRTVYLADRVLGEQTIPLIQDYLKQHEQSPDILDLGCGTGLCGRFLRKRVAINRLDGVEISAKMINKARMRQESGERAYDLIDQSDLRDYLREAKKSYDFIIAAGVLDYMGRLEEFFQLVVARLKEGGTVVVTFQDIPEKRKRKSEDYTKDSHDEVKGNMVLLPYSDRFCYSLDYVKAQGKFVGLKVERVEPFDVYVNSPGYCITFAL